MPNPLRLTLACNLYDRSQPILAGQVRIEGCEINFVPLQPEEAHLRAFDGADFDITEMSMSSHLIATAAGGSPYLALPAFVSRAFRHSSLYIRTDRGIRSASDLSGKVVGVPEYQMTAAIWVRGFLSSDFGVKSEDVKWRTGGVNAPGRKERMKLDLPAKFDVAPIGDHVALSDALAEGRIDALLSVRTPACFTKGDPQVARLFPDYHAAERDYFQRTGIFPIMHGVGVRRDLVDRHPWLARSVYKAFLEAKNIALMRFYEMGALAVSHPWLALEADRLKDLMGQDFWPYGVGPNEAALKALIQYAREQGLIHRDVAIEELVFTRVSDKPFAL